MASMELQVLICGRHAGVVRQDEAGLMSFRYLNDYEGVPLSLSMPLGNRTYRQDVVRPFLFGLLPDDEMQRQAIAREYEVSPNNPIMLLDHIGLDCQGGVQFCREGDLEDVLNRPGSHRRLSEHELAQRLKSIRDDDNASWMGRDESWSLGGNQGKFALALEGDTWCECLGSSPTTHIFKNGVRGFRLEALNEFCCMKAASLCAIPTADVSYLRFEDEYALVVERYDRVRNTQTDLVRRVHQEDLCQALSVMPNQKYTSDGGPTTRDVLMLLSKTGQADANLRAFAKMLFFNYLIGAPDAHAKNYSLLLGVHGQALLAKMYDVASGFPYERLRLKGRLAMSLGGENRFGRVGSGAIRRFAGERDPDLAEALGRHGIDEAYCVDLMANLAGRLPDALEQVLVSSAAITGVDELSERLLSPVKENCDRTLALL